MTQLAILYSRVSTDRQDNSIAIQDARLRSYLELRGLESRPELILGDEDVSGRIPLFERPNGRRVMDLLRHGLQDDRPLALPPVPVQHLVIKTVDRLARNARDALELYEWFEDNGKVLHIVDVFGEPVTSRGIMGKMFFAFQALFAELEVETIRERIRTTLTHKFENQELIGTVPYGYDKVPTGEISAKGKAIHAIVPNDDEQRWLRQMWDWRHVFNLSYNKIAKALNAAGVPTKIPAGLPVRRKINGVMTEVGQTSGLWQCGNVQGVLESKHTARLCNDVGPVPSPGEGPMASSGESERKVA